jgi:hypothetical protein
LFSILSYRAMGGAYCEVGRRPNEIADSTLGEGCE